MDRVVWIPPPVPLVQLFHDLLRSCPLFSSSCRYLSFPLQQAGGKTLEAPAVEITYGMERILMALQVWSHGTTSVESGKSCVVVG
jgi:hypothetical protein